MPMTAANASNIPMLICGDVGTSVTHSAVTCFGESILIWAVGDSEFAEPDHPAKRWPSTVIGATVTSAVEFA